MSSILVAAHQRERPAWQTAADLGSRSVTRARQRIVLPTVAVFVASTARLVIFVAIVQALSRARLQWTAM
jgi:hypothetical protein